MSKEQHGRPGDQQLVQSLRSALRSGEPLEFLALVGGLLEVTDPRPRDPFAPDHCGRLRVAGPGLLVSRRRGELVEERDRTRKD